jgi:hypothetical protein
MCWKHVEAINRNKLKTNGASCWSYYADIQNRFYFWLMYLTFHNFYQFAIINPNSILNCLAHYSPYVFNSVCKYDVIMQLSVRSWYKLFCTHISIITLPKYWYLVESGQWTYIHQVLSSIPIHVCVQTFSHLGNENNTSPPSPVSVGSMPTLNF